MIKKLLMLAVTSGLAAKALQMWMARETERRAGAALALNSSPAQSGNSAGSAVIPVQRDAAPVSVADLGDRVPAVAKAVWSPLAPPAVDATSQARAGQATFHTGTV